MNRQPERNSQMKKQESENEKMRGDFNAQLLKRFNIALVIFISLGLLMPADNLVNAVLTGPVMSVGTHYGNAGATDVIVPIEVTDVAGSSEDISADIELQYASLLLNGPLNGPLLLATSVDDEGCISNIPGTNLISNLTIPGKVKIAVAGTAPMQGSGCIARVHFDVLTSAPNGSASSLILAQSNIGPNSVDAVNGTFNIGTPNQVPALRYEVELEAVDGKHGKYYLHAEDPDSEEISLSYEGLDSIPGEKTMTTVAQGAGKKVVAFKWEPSAVSFGAGEEFKVYAFVFKADDGRDIATLGISLKVWSRLDTLTADFNGDGWVHMRDFLHLSVGWTGPGGAIETGYENADLDGDGDVDSDDLTIFWREYGNQA